MSPRLREMGGGRPFVSSIFSLRVREQITKDKGRENKKKEGYIKGDRKNYKIREERKRK